MNLSPEPLSPEESRARLVAYVRALTVACPYNQGNPSDCPLCRVRELPLHQRIEWVKGLTLVQMESISQYHGLCLSEKLANSVLNRNDP